MRVPLALALLLTGLALAASAPAATPLDVDFDLDQAGFGFIDDAFRGTVQPAYASGSWIASGGFSGGALSVTLGDQDELSIVGMSAGWQGGFDVVVVEELELQFRYSLTQSQDYEASELSQVMVSLDGVPLAGLGVDYVVQIAGDGNGGAPIGTGWGLYRANLGTLAAGPHTLTIGGYNSQKTTSSEVTDILIDDVRISTAEPLVLVSGDLLVPDAGLGALLRVDAATGERSVISSIGRGSGPALDFPRGVAAAGDGSVYIVDDGLQAVLWIDSATGDREIVSDALTGTGDLLVSPYDIKIESDGGLLVSDVGLLAVVHVDPVSGDRSVVASNAVGLGATLVRPSDIWIEPSGDVLVADGGSAAADTVIRIDRSSGDRSYVSAPGVRGVGPSFDDLSGIASATPGEIVVTDVALDTVFLVDPNTGDRSILSDPTTGGGEPIGQLFAIEPETSGDYLVVDVPWRAVLRIDGVSGLRNLVSSHGVGGGPLFDDPRDVVLVPPLDDPPPPAPVPMLPSWAVVALVAFLALYWLRDASSRWGVAAKK